MNKYTNQIPKIKEGTTLKQDHNDDDDILAFDDDDVQQHEPGLQQIENNSEELPQLQKVKAPVKQLETVRVEADPEEVSQNHLTEQPQQNQFHEDQLSRMLSDNTSSEEDRKQVDQSIVDFNDQASKIDQSVIDEDLDVVPPLQQFQQQDQQIQEIGDDQPTKSKSKVNPFPPKFELDRLPQNAVQLRDFLINPFPKGRTLQCFIKRSKSGLARIYPVYHLYTTDGSMYLCSAKKVVMNTTSNYVISMNKSEFSTKKECYLGKVRSNFLGTEFLLFDNGKNPKKTKDMSVIRNQLGVVYYESHILAHKGPRKMKVLLPKVGELNIAKIFQPMSSKEGLQFEYQKGNTEFISEFINKPPVWNTKMKAHVLDFYGRVDQPSVKNFQLISPEETHFINLQFGRVDEITFNLDFCWPFSPLQALQICVSSFDFKFACE